MSAILKFDFQKREQVRFSEVNYLNYTKKRPNFACGNYIFPKTRGNKNKPWTHSTPLKAVEFAIHYKIVRVILCFTFVYGDAFLFRISTASFAHSFVLVLFDANFFASPHPMTWLCSRNMKHHMNTGDLVVIISFGFGCTSSIFRVMWGFCFCFCLFFVFVFIAAATSKNLCSLETIPVEPLT